MKTKLTIAAGCLIAGLSSALAAPVPEDPVAGDTRSVAKAATGSWSGFLAPAEFDVPYQGTLTIWRAKTIKDLAVIGQVKEPGYSGVAFTATMHTKDGLLLPVCDIYIVEDGVLKASHYTLAFVLRHELAHCNGWPGNHPGARKVPVNSVKMPALPASTRWLPAYPPIACITPERTVESCEKRKGV